MTDDYSSRCLGCFHPGGYALTKHAFELVKLSPGATICDIGCGHGDNMENLSRDFGLLITGVEPSAAMRGDRYGILATSAEHTGLPSESFDCVLCECVLSLCSGLAPALSEVRRILKPGGALILSDVYSGSEELRCDGLFGWFYTLRQYLGEIRQAGFSVHVIEDHTRHLQHMCAQLILDGAGGSLCDTFRHLREARCGYFLTISRKEST